MTTFRLADTLPCDLGALIDTRLLVQANSGGGKSWALRRLLEQTHGRVQHLVIDPEGEFASLREKYDYVLAARNGGDTAADPRSAKLLAERLLELGVSAILDIYELKAHDRIRFVRAFLEALVDAPKTLWHPALVILDEAHVFCPQVGEAESAGAVIDLATRGRKRGFCAVLATQRLSKLHKDAAAECNNKLIGRTGLDVDVKRAADELGFGKESAGALRQLKAGEFFAFGPALSREVTNAFIGPVETTHPKAGARLAFTAPPPTDKVRALLPKLAGLPAEAEKRQQTVDDLRGEVARLTRELRQAHTTTPAPPPAERLEVPVPLITDAQIGRMEQVVSRAEKVKTTIEALTAALEASTEAQLDDVINLCKEVEAGLEAAKQRLAIQPPVGARTTLIRQQQAPRSTPTQMLARATAIMVSRGPGESLTGPERKILTALAQHGACAVVKLAMLAGYHSRSKGFTNALGACRSRGWVEGSGTVALTTAGAQALGSWEPLPTGRALLDTWLARVSGPERKILEVLAVNSRPTPPDDVAAAAGYHPRSKGFTNALGRLRTLELVRGQRGEPLRLTEEFYG